MSDQQFKGLSLMMDYPFPTWLDGFGKGSGSWEYPGHIGWNPGYSYSQNDDGYGDGLFGEFDSSDGEGIYIDHGSGCIPTRKVGRED